MAVTMNARNFCYIPLVNNPHNMKRGRGEDEEPYWIVKRPNHFSEAGEYVAWPMIRQPERITLAGLSFHQELGAGSFGKVMLASHLSTNQLVAVKMVKKSKLLEGSRDSIFIERQVLEVTQSHHLFTHCYGTCHNKDQVRHQKPSARKLLLPACSILFYGSSKNKKANILAGNRSFIRAGETYLFYFMEYVSGGDLWYFIDERAPCDMATIRFIVAEIFCALRYLHKKRIIHRDLKPENVLLDCSGHVKIADFGLSVICESEVTGRAGTPGYMAPEILSGKSYGTAVDYFSFGAIIYQMATKKMPFCDGPDKKVLRSIRRVKYSGTLHPHIRGILKGLFCTSPSDRQRFGLNMHKKSLFEGIDWTALEEGRTQPPYTIKPAPIEKRAKIPLDDVLSVKDKKESPLTLQEQMLFYGFSYTSNQLN